MYVVTRDDLYLVPTAEVPVTNIHRDEIFEADQLPVRYVAYSPCFRREAGAAGAKTRGILRVHQFDKVEMVCFERPDDSGATLEWLTARAEIALQRLGLAYRVKLMASGDVGFTQAKKYDLEVWAPGAEDWLEVSSVSNFRDYQARRMNIRWRPEPGAKPEILHTLNGSGPGARPDGGGDHGGLPGARRLHPRARTSCDRGSGIASAPDDGGGRGRAGGRGAAGWTPAGVPRDTTRPGRPPERLQRERLGDVHAPGLGGRPRMAPHRGQLARDCSWCCWTIVTTSWRPPTPRPSCGTARTTACPAAGMTSCCRPSRTTRPAACRTPWARSRSWSIRPARGAACRARCSWACGRSARERRMRALIACVRPTWKERYPLVPIERYATWTRDDGLPFDPWMRLHAKLGGRIVRAVPHAMTIPGSVADWESWTGMAFPESGDYVVPRAAALVSIDRERGPGRLPRPQRLDDPRPRSTRHHPHPSS